MRIGLLLISTGRYDIFLQPLIDSVDKFFFRNDNITIYLFTDKIDIKLLHSDRINIIIILTEHKPFPYATLLRYKYFTEASDRIDTDWCFYSDVDMRFVSEVGREILPSKSGLVATLHPGFYNGGGSWCTNTKSTAYTINRIKYYAGGFQGGTRDKYLEVCKELSNNIQKDEDNGVMAEWHDESAWNFYLSNHTFKELSPSYCYPESWKIPFAKKLLALDKNHAEMRK